MTGLAYALAYLAGALRVVIFASGVIVAVLAALSFAVRTRRLNPFGSVGQLTRRSVDPLFAPMERRVLRAGGNPASAPWWTLAAVVIGGIILISFLDWLVGQIVSATTMAAAGPRGLLALLVSWTFGVLQLALFARVISSWFQLSPYSKWIRWAFVLTEWFLAPLRNVIPPLGMIDLSPLIAYFALNLLEGVVLRLI